MTRVLQRIERLLFGATGEERAALLNALIDQSAQQVLANALERQGAEDQQGGWHDMRTGQTVAEADLPPLVRAFAQRVSAAYDEAQPTPNPPTTAADKAGEQEEPR